MPLRRETIAEGDYLILKGDADAAARFAASAHLALREEADTGEGGNTLFNRSSGLAEVVIPPRSGLIGSTAFPGMVTESGDLIILSVSRAGVTLDAAETELQVGDTLLLQGTWKALDERLADPDVLVVNSPELVRRQAVPMGPGAKQAVVILLAMVLLLATGIVPTAVAGMLAAGAVVLSGIMNVEHAYRAINWTTVIMVAAMMPLSTAMEKTGAAQLMAEHLVAAVGDYGPYALLGGLVRADRGARSAHLQHRHRADRHSHRRGLRQGAGHVTRAGADVDGGRRRGVLPHAHRHADEPYGHGTWRLCLRRLLEARPAADDLVLRGGDLLHTLRLEVLN